MFASAWEIVTTSLSWIGLAYAVAGAGVFVFGIGFVIWHESIKPRLIPREEISRLADDITARHPDDPDYAAYRELEAAWWKTDGITSITIVVEPRMVRTPAISPAERLVTSCCAGVAFAGASRSIVGCLSLNTGVTRPDAQWYQQSEPPQTVFLRASAAIAFASHDRIRGARENKSSNCNSPNLAMRVPGQSGG